MKLDASIARVGITTVLATWPTVLFPAECADATALRRDIIVEFQSRQRNVGLHAAVMVDGSLVFSESFGLADREREVPVTGATQFGIASITKAFTGLTLLRLAHAGAIDLDASVRRYVPEFPEHPTRPQSLRAVAAQLSGIRHWGDERNEALYARRLSDVEEILPLFLDDPFVDGNEGGYSYSSYAYNLLAIAMQRATGTPFQELVTEHVIAPLDLTDVAFDAPGYGGARRAARYSWYALDDFHEFDDTPVRVPDRDYSHNMAGGNMVSTVVGLVRLGAAVVGPGFLDAGSWSQLWTRLSIDGASSPMSFGWFVDEGGDRLRISGSNPGLQAGLAVWKSGATVVAVVANTWGLGSSSGELVDDDPDGFLGKLATPCAARL